MVVGSGKTIAYMAPLINRLKDEEEQLGVITRFKKPRALIILPSRDLAHQVLVSYCEYGFIIFLFFIVSREIILSCCEDSDSSCDWWQEKGRNNINFMYMYICTYMHVCIMYVSM